ncbi:MAG: hypothetical protein AAGC55_02365 [Myxococcota bacterium]
MNIVFLEISEYGDEAKELRDITKFDLETTEEGAGVVKTINRRRRARHHKEGINTYSLELETAIGVKEEVDWRALQSARRLFVLTYEEAGTDRRYQLPDCRITSIKQSSDAEGEYRATVSITPLDHVRIA